LRPAFDCARHWADPSTGAHADAEQRLTAASSAAWLGTRIVDAMRSREAPLAALLELVETIPIVAGDPSGLGAVVQRADCLRELGRLDQAEAVLAAVEVDAFGPEGKPNATALIAACRADLDVYVGNHDEALQRVLPHLPHLGELDLAVALRLAKARAFYLLSAERFDEVDATVTDFERRFGAAMTAGERELFTLCSAIAATQSTESDETTRAAARTRLAALVAEASASETRCWAAIHAARAALAADDADAAADCLASAHDEANAVGDELSRSLSVTGAEIALCRHRVVPQPPELLRRHADDLERAWQEMQAERSRLPSRPSGNGFLHYATRRDLLALRVALQLELDPSPTGVERALATVLAGLTGVQPRRRGVSDRSDSAETPGLRELRQHALIDDGHGMLLYLPGSRESHLFVCDRATVEHIGLRGSSQLHAVTRRFGLALDAATVSTASTASAGSIEAAIDRLRRDGGAVATALLPEPARAALRRWHAVSILGSEMLPQAAFESVPLGEDLLGEILAIDHWPNPEFALRPAPPTPTPGRPMPVTLFGRVARTDDEAELTRESVAGWLRPDAATRMLLGSECSTAAFADLAATAMLVLLAHGELRPELVRPLVLQFADRDFTCDDAAQFGNARFIVLAACNAAVGPNRFGAATRADLAGAFLT
ncbi:MAG: hypothetical protein KDE27_15275, partial [Planctomycetes bacterium]|nr:hypothetical protein [Planctomycetota bacterium]